MNFNPDQIWYDIGFGRINATILSTWIVMLTLVGISALVTRRLSSDMQISRLQNLLEIIVTGLRDQIREVSRQEPGVYLPFVGTLFLFIAMANLLAIVPGYLPPTGSLSTTAALATCVFVAVPVFGVSSQGIRGYLSQYIKPSLFMLPFNIVGELSRTLALAVRLYGNVMSGSVIAMILLAITPLFVPVVMQLFGLLTGLIQAYIFAILAMVYIASASRAHEEEQPSDEQSALNSTTFKKGQPHGRQ